MKSKDRLILALAISIALHEIAAGLVPRDLIAGPPSHELIAAARVTRISVKPTATPTPRPPAPDRVKQRRTVVATRFRPVPSSEQRPGRRRATDRSASVAFRPTEFARSKPLWDTNAGAASGSSTPAQLGGQGGNGSGAAGSGNDATTGEPPCGFVEFSDPHGSRYDRQTGGFYVDIRMSVHFADGSSQSLILDYPWYYASEAANPWSARNLKDPNFPTRFQPPPVPKLVGEPPLVRYVIAHSTADGLTLLKDCPGPAPTPAA
jgi:hypothetical protein